VTSVPPLKRIAVHPNSFVNIDLQAPKVLAPLPHRLRKLLELKSSTPSHWSLCLLDPKGLALFLMEGHFDFSQTERFTLSQKRVVGVGFSFFSVALNLLPYEF